MASLNYAHAITQALWHGSCSIDLNGQNGPRYDQDPVRLQHARARSGWWTLEAGGYRRASPPGLQAAPHRVDDDGVRESARRPACATT